MKDYMRESEVTYVLDTTALIARVPLYIRNNCVTTNSVLNEVKDKYSIQGLELIDVIGKLKIVNPNEKYIKKILKKAIQLGEINLSKTDIEVAALAYQLKYGTKNHIVVITDDYSLQNLIAHLCIEFMPLRTRGIKSKVVYEVFCPNCNWKLAPKYGKLVSKCPRCGMKLERRIIKTLNLHEECNEVTRSSMNMGVKS